MAQGKACVMIRSELVAALARENPGLRMEEVEKIVSTFFDEISAKLASGGRVELRGFGAFSTRARDPRKGRNPRTGAEIKIKAAKVPKFRPGKALKDAVN